MKKGIYIILLLITGFLSVQLTAQTCSKTINSSTPYIDWKNPAFNDIRPGDTVCLQAGNWNYIELKNFHGTAEKPIVFINSGGTVIINTDNYFGIKIANSSHIVFTGSGDSQAKYGFNILKVLKGAGMSIGDYSTNIEIAHVEISHTLLAGVYAKTDPTCSNFGATRDKFVMYNFSFHDNYVHDVADEGLYIGNSHFTGFHLTNGCDTVVYAQVLKGVHIYNNIIKHTGYDGIQVSSADSNCSIHDNTISFDSQAGVLSQMSGILIGGGSKCNTYNNKIINGKGDGIDVFGLGNFKIFNNLIVNAGQTYLPDQPDVQKHGIYIGTDSTSANAQLGIYNNTIVSPKSFGIDLVNSQLAKTSIINNLITTPGKYSTMGSAAYINIGKGVSLSRVVEKTNYTSDTISQVKFINPNNLNFDLQADSPAVDYGTNLTAEGITFDILNRSRPFHTYFDAGAYETHNSSVGIRNYTASDVESLKVFPNPARYSVQLELILKNTQYVRATLTDVLGRLMLIKKFHCNSGQPCSQSLDLAPFSGGWYFLNIFTKKGKTSVPIIVQP